MTILSTPTATGAVGPADWCRAQYIMCGGDKITSGLRMAWLAGRTVRIDAGTGAVGGIAFTSVTSLDFLSDMERSGNPRADRLVARKTWPSLQVEFAILKGAPSADPVLPALTQDHGGVWEFGLGYWVVPAGNDPNPLIVDGNVWGHFQPISRDDYRTTLIGVAGVAESALILAVTDFRVPGSGRVEIDVVVYLTTAGSAAGAVTIQALGQSKSVTWRVNYNDPSARPLAPLSVPVRMVADVPAGGGVVATIVQVSTVAGGQPVTVTHVSADLVEIMP